MNRHRFITFLEMIAMIVTGLLPAASLAAAPAAAPADLLVTFPGNWVNAAGLGNDWAPDNLATRASDANSDGVWKFNAPVPAGSYEFKATVGGSWEENYGVNGVPNGDNVPFTSTGGDVRFYYDRSDNFVASRPNTTIPVIAGNFVGAIGGSDWSPDNLKTWMKDRDGDGVYTFSATVPAQLGVQGGVERYWDVAFPASNRAQRAGLWRCGFLLQRRPTRCGRGGQPIGDEDLVAERCRGDQDEVMYFALPDRFDNGDPSNDEGAFPGGTLAQTGFLPRTSPSTTAATWFACKASWIIWPGWASPDLDDPGAEAPTAG